MYKKLNHYFQRSRELGPWGTLHRVWTKTLNTVVIWVQSLWWGWKARREMSDVVLLKCTNGNWQSVDALLDHLASRPASSFLLPHESAQETSALLYHHYPDYVSAVLAAAEAACRNEFTLLGQVFHFPHGLDWHSDPVMGWRWPRLHRNRLGTYLYSPMNPADPVFLWELNRHQHFITLGIAYWLTGDQRYVDVFCSQVQDWIEANPLQHGINWYYGLEVAIRLIAWTVAFQFFRQSAQFREKFGKAFLKSLWVQVDFLSKHLQTTRPEVPNNHIIAELVSLILVAAAFPEFSTSGTWRENGLHLLNEQAVAQTHPDGVNKEQATGYHRFITELLLLVVARSRQGALPPEPLLEHTLGRMLDYVLSTLTPDGTAPQWGDSDYGRALGLGQNKDFWDFRPVLSAGAVLFGRADWKFAAGHFDEEAFWLLGSDGLNRWNQLEARPPEQTSYAFPQAGLYIIRDSWSSDTDVAFFRCGPFGLGGEWNCAHAHCDLLSLILWVSGRPLLVDSGTYIYHGSWRDYFRLTAAHNTVMIDDGEQAVPKPNFCWQQIPAASCLDWRGERVTGRMTYPGQVELIREVSLARPGVWDLLDMLQGNTNEVHKVDWFFHFAPNLILEKYESCEHVKVQANGKSYIEVIPPEGVHVEIGNSWYSYSYGHKELNPYLRASWLGEISFSGIDFTWKFLNTEGSQ